MVDRTYDHVLRILGFDRLTHPDHPVIQALESASYTTFSELFTLRRANVEVLTYTDNDVHPPVQRTIPMGNQTRLLIPQGYRVYFNNNSQRAMTSYDWLLTTADDINDYMMSDEYMYFNNSDGSSSVPGPPPAVTKPKVALETFKKSIRRDPSQFKPFSDKRYWATWHLQFVATARAQDLQDLLDPNYVPSSSDDIAVFQAKQEYLYSVFVNVLLTDEGKALVRAQYMTSNAQVIFKNLCDHHTNSTQSELTSTTILQFITSFRLGKQPWKGKTTVSFVAYFVEQLRLYDELTHTQGPPMNDIFKRAMLDNAVQGIEDLRQVRITQATLCQQLGKVPTFSEYLDLLTNAATIYDDHHNQGNVTRNESASRRVYATQATDSSYGDDYFQDDYGRYDVFQDDGAAFDLDEPISTITAFAAQQNRAHRPAREIDPESRLSAEIFSRLSVDDKRTWTRLSADARRMILTSPNKSERQSDNSTSSHVGGLSSVNRRVLMAEQSVDDDAPPDEPKDNKHPHDATSDLIAMVTKRHPGDVRRLLSQSSSSGKTDFKVPSQPNQEWKVNATCTYSVARSATNIKSGALIDRGANGGLAGSDCRVIMKSPDRFVNIEGIDKHRLPQVPVVTCGAYTESRNHGPVIMIFHQFAGMLRGPTIISSAQLEAYHAQVNERSRRVDPGGQLITTNDGFEFPLHIRHGLAYLDMRPYTDDEWESLPHVVMTSDVDWDPGLLDGEFPLTGQESSLDTTTYHNGTPFDIRGDYMKGTLVASARRVHDDGAALVTAHTKPHHGTVVICPPDPGNHDAGMHLKPQAVLVLPPAEPPAEPPPDDPDVPTFTNISPHLTQAFTDSELLRKFFAFLPASVVERTMKATTQYARVPMHDVMKRFYRSPYPALNVARRNEDLLTDVVYSDTPAIDDGSTSASVYSGRHSHVLDVFGMKTDKQFVTTLEDVIRERGAPTRLLSDHALTIRSQRVVDILRALYIGAWTSEPHRQNQNTMERRYQTLKRVTNLVMDRSGCPASCWLLCLQYVAMVLNSTACQSLNWAIPLTVLLGVTIDVSPLLRFHWYQPVLYHIDSPSFPSESTEALGYFVGVATHCGHMMTFKILTDDTQRVINRSQVRPADDPHRPNLRLTDLFDGEPPSKLFVKSKSDPDNIQDLPAISSESGEIEQNSETTTMVHVDTSELIGKTFLMEGDKEGTTHRARIVEMVEDQRYAHLNSKEHTKFRVSVNNDTYEDIMTYGEILTFLNKDEEQEVLWRYKSILGHQGPLISTDEGYNGSTYNVQVEWENGEVTFEPLSIIAADDPVSCAIYAREHDLLDTPGWKRFKKIANREKKLLRMANQAKLRSFNTAPKFKYGYELPRNYDHAVFLDNRNGNTKWQDAAKLEFDQLDEYSTFEDLGDSNVSNPPAGHKRIRVHLVFDVKHDGRHKVRCVADGHLTEIPLDSVYSGVVSLRGLRIVLFLAELNRLNVWATDIGNAYLEAETKELIYIIAGSEFGPRKGHILIIKKALYGLRSSGKRWHERFADCLRDEGFAPCKTEPDVWIRPNKDRSCYEMVAVYVDDLAIGMEDPEVFLNVLMAKYKFKLKGSGPIMFHLGCDFNRDQENTLCMSPHQYIDRMANEYERMFGSKPHTRVTSPLERNDHPEIDDSELLDEAGVQRYQSLIGSLQWAVSLGRFDITTAVMTMSGFRAIPRKGHLERAKRIVCYLYRFKSARIRFRTNEPDLSDVVQPDHDWSDTVYGKVQEEIPRDIPMPLGKPVVTVSYVDANLLHCMVTGKSVTGILHFLNGTPIDWYSKKMNTVETATYGAEFVSARTCVEQLVDLRITLRYMGVPLREKSYIFGDNESVVNSATQPYAKLHKRHNVLSFHKVREAIASGVFVFTHIPGENNPADILSKHWGYSSVWHMLRTIMFVDGETVDSPGRNDKVDTGTISVNAVTYRAFQCNTQYKEYGHGAVHTVVHRDRGVTTFEKEWVHWYLLQYIMRGCIMVLLKIARELSSSVEHTNSTPVLSSITP